MSQISEALSPKIDLSVLDSRIIPTPEAIQKVSQHYTNYKRSAASGHPSFPDTPWGLAASIRDSHKKIQYYFAAVALGWTELADKLKATLQRDGYTADEIYKIRDYILGEFESINDACENYPLTEDIEKHDKLNPKLFLNDKLIPEVRTKLLEIVDAFEDEISLNGVILDIRDIVVIGSNVSYNYTKDSDIDLHIIANSAALDCPEEISLALYSAYRSLFNNKLDIDFYGIPVEIYVETDKIETISNGIYSVIKDEWVKEPVPTEIPEIDKEAFNKEYAPWETAYNAIKEKVRKEELTDETEVVQFIEDIYNQRKAGLSSGGEYSTGNLIFKELRNKGYLDDLKELRDELLSKRLSLEEDLSRQKLDNASREIVRATGRHITMRKNGYFTIENVSEHDIDLMLYRVKRVPCVAEASKRDAGFDAKYSGWKRPEKFYDIVGHINDQEESQ